MKMDSMCLFYKQIYTWISKWRSNYTQCHTPHLPAFIQSDLSELDLIFTFSRYIEHEFVVTIMLYIFILRDEIHIQNANVHLQPRFSYPVKVRGLSHVSDIICRLQIPCAMEILQKYVVRSLDSQSYMEKKNVVSILHSKN